MNNLFQIKETDIATPTNYIGSGKFGRVFTSKYKNKDVVYKIMKHGISLKMFINELTILQSLQGHFGIVGLHGYIVSPNKMIIVMEHAKGITLHDLISYYDITYAKTLLICRQIVSTMIYIHSKNIVYCDLKPDNIIIDPETSNVKLLDFGLSIQLDASNKVARGDPCGTTGYIAPEVLFNGCFGIKCDVYSFGVLLFVIHTNRNPTHVSKMKIILKHHYERNIYKLFCQCVQTLPKNRPSFIEIYNTIVRLEAITEKYNKFYTNIYKKFFSCCFP